MNQRVRDYIKKYIENNGACLSRTLIGIMAKKFSVPRQQISGNLSYMICGEGSLQVIPRGSGPDSLIFI